MSLSPTAQSRRDSLLALAKHLREISTELQADLDGEFGEDESAYTDEEWTECIGLISNLQHGLNTDFITVYSA